MSGDQVGCPSYARVVPVLTVPSVAMAEPLAEALVEGGMRCAEVTLRTPDDDEVLATMAAHRGLTVGAGTVLTRDQARRAVAAGAAFVASAGFDEDLVAACWELGVPFIPGVATATELMRAQAAAYLAHPSVSAVGGSWMTPPECLEHGDYSRIRQLAAQAAKLGAS